jgi:hypothetical protein
VKVTAETLTDEQIRAEMATLAAERDELDGRPTTRGGEARDAYARSVAMNRLISAGRVALKEKRARRGDSRNDCRIRIADAINARGGAS